MESLPLLKPQVGRELIRDDASPWMRPETLNTIPTRPFPPLPPYEARNGIKIPELKL